MTAVKLSVKENKIERELRQRVGAAGGECTKVQAIGRRGFFDRVVILPGGRVVFVEVKRPKRGRISAHQIQYHERFAELGVAIALVKTSADIDVLLKM
jgi:Holliday junction resolvase